MDEEFKKLHDYVAYDQYSEALSFLQVVTSSFEKEISDAVVDTYILNIFDESYGFLSFIEKTVNRRVNRDVIAQAITECVEIIYSVVKNFTQKVAKYTPQIREICLKIILTSNSQPKEKRRALFLLQLLFERTDYYPNGYLSREEVFSKLCSTYEAASGEVLGLTIKTMGVMVKRYPSVLNDPGEVYNSVIAKLKVNIFDRKESPVGECFAFISAFLAVNPNVAIVDVYECIKKRMSVDTYRKTSLREAITLLAEHAILFEKEIHNDAEFWHKLLEEWLDYRGENLKAAYQVFDALYESLSKTLAVDRGSNRYLCTKFWDKFVRDVFHSNLYGYRLRVAIRAFGHFASTAKVFLPASVVNATFYDFINKIERTYLIDSEEKPDELAYLPEYIQTLSNIIQQLDEVTQYELGILQRATILMIRLFPQLSSHHHNLVVVPTLKAYARVRTRNRSMAQQYLLHVVKEGIIYSCSCAVSGEDTEYFENVTTYRDYIPFWKNLINKYSIRTAISDVEGDTVAQVRIEIFDELMATLLYLMDKLNLSTKLAEESSTFTDPKATLTAVKVYDFNIFVNAVDLYTDILKTIDGSLFKKWTRRFLNVVMVKCRRHPLVSGFYKLLAAALDISNDLNYFDETRLEREDVRLCYRTIADFVSGIIAKVKLYNNDLKLSCIRVILSTPTSIVINMLENVTPVMISLLVLGRSNLEYAEMGLDTLERWRKAIKQEDFDVFLKEVLPYLNTYLCSKSISEKFDAKTTKTRKTRLEMSRRKIVAVTEGNLFKLQKKILSFIGGLSNDMCRSFVEDNEMIGDSLFYGKDLHLNLKLQFPNNFAVELYVEKLIARVIELALYSSERKLRINACEVLHAMVLVFLAKTKQMTDEPRKDLHGLLKKTISALLLLGCDADVTVQKILQPLVLQLMHWYSSEFMKVSSHTAIVIEAVLDGVTQTADSALRDFSCSCVKEFVEWSIKQSTKRGMAKDPINIEIVIRKIKFFSSHSDPSKRFAAALIFNNVYRILREDEYIFQAYWLELLHSFVTNLSLVDEYDEYDCLAQVHASLNHLRRGLVEKSEEFNEQNRFRKIPPSFERGLLIDVACWLLKQTGSPNRHCREKCFDLFLSVAPLCGEGDLPEFMEYFRSISGNNWMHELYFRNNTLRMDDLSVETLFKWMSDFLCLLDAHLFFQRSGIAVDQSVLTPFYEAAHDFYKQILHPSVDLSRNFTFTSMDKERFNTLKSGITKKYVRYFVTSGRLNEEEHLSLLAESIFENDSLLAEDIRAQEVNFLLENMKDDLVDRFVSAVHRYLAQTLQRNYDLRAIVPFKQRQLLKGLLILSKSRFSEKLSLKKYTENSLKDLVEKMMESENVVVTLQDTAEEYCRLKMELSLRNDDVEVLVDILRDQKLVRTAQQRNEVEFGKYVFGTFKSTIIESLGNNLRPFLRLLLEKDGTNTLYFVEEIIVFLSMNRKLFNRDFVEEILSHWVTFREFYDGKIENRVRGVMLLEKMSPVIDTPVQSNVEYVQEPWSWTMEFVESLISDVTLLPHKKFEFLSCWMSALSVFLKGGEIDDNLLDDLGDRLKRLEQNYFLDLHPEMKVAAALFVNKSFQAAILAKSNCLFAFASKIFVLVQPKDDLNVDQFCKAFMKIMDTESQARMLDLIYRTDCTDYPLVKQYDLTREILANLLRHSAYEALEKFYVKNIPEIMALIRKKCENSKEYLKKTNAFILIRILLTKIKISEGGGVLCPITLSAFPNTKNPKQLVKELIRDTAQLLKDSKVYEDELRNWDRICKCESYNALISAVCNTQRETIFYDLVFKRDASGRNQLWRNVVDLNRNYGFPVDFEKIPKKREHLVSIRSTYREKRRRGVAESLKYIESQNIFESTVSEDIVKYDLSRSILRSQEYGDNDTAKGVRRGEMQIDIDADELNSHECMLMLCGLFRHLHDEKIYGAQSESGAVPAYVDSIRKDLENDDTPRNVKLFLLKALENERELFKPYANALFGSVMKAIVDGVAGDNINYFVADLIVMLVFWADGLENVEANESVSALALFLITNVNPIRAAVMKYHIDLLKFFVEQWKDHITVPKDYLLDQLKTLSKSERVLPIIHVSSIFLANDLPPWDDIKTFVKCLVDILSQTKRAIYKSCAEAIGTALAYAKKHERAKVLGDFSKYIGDQIKKLKDRDNKKIDENKQLVCLQEIMKHYPEICDGRLGFFVMKYNSYSGPYKGICLKIFHDRIDVLHECMDFQIMLANLENLVSDDNDQFKVLGLEIVRKSLPVIDFGGGSRFVVKREKFLAFLEKVSKFIFSENNVCRSTTYELFMDVFRDNRLCEDEEIRSKSREVLLQGLVDHNAEIEETLTNFWARMLPADTSGKFIFLLRNMHKASIENRYLGYCVNFLLNELVLNENYDRAVFDFDLADCTYTDYKIKDNWRERHSSLAPMFAQSFQSQSVNFDVGTSASASTFGDELKLRVTNEYMEFEPTYEPELLEIEKRAIIDRLVDVPDENEDDPDADVFKKPVPVKVWKRRFHKDQTRDDQSFALRKMEQNTKVEKQRRDSMKQKRQEVNIYRSYRQGDFPDIKLTLSDLVAPLKILMKHDNGTARIFYTILFESITDKVTDDRERFVQETVEGVNAIFDSSTLYDTNLMGALLDVALKHKSFRFSPDTIAKVSFNSGLLSSGALLLEEYLDKGFESDSPDGGPAPKRSRGYTNSAEVDCWVKLADLYKELEEWDLVRAIFLHKMNCDETVINAIINESQSLWREAQELYLKVISSDESLERRGFYYESYYKCFAELSDWSDLSTSIKMTVGEESYWKELWDDEWHQQKLLPWYMIAQLRNGLSSEDVKNSFVAEINDALSDTDKLIYVKQNFSEEIAFLYLLTGNFDKVMYFILNNIELFLSSWSNISPLLTSLKMKKLLKIQNSIEIYNFITKFNNFNELNRNGIVNDMCKDWLRVYREDLSSIVSSETRTIYRTQCLSILQTKFDSEDVRKRLDKVKFQLEMNLAKTAVEMKNFHVTKKYVSKNNSYAHTESKEGVKFTVLFSRLLQLKAVRLASIEKQMEFLVEAWKPLGDCLTNDIVTTNPTLRLSVNTHIYEITQDLSRILQTNQTTIDDPDLAERIGEISGFAPPYTSDTVADYSFRTLRLALDDVVATTVVDSRDEITLNAIAEGHFKLASFVGSKPGREGDLIRHVLKAMLYGSPEARHIFPCLLDVAELGSTHKEAFLTEVENIPEWMFIRWIPQLLANLDGPNVAAIFPILERIARKYPQAIMYAYRLSKQKYNFDGQPFEKYGKQAIERLDELLGDAFVDKFLEALSSVSICTNVVLYHTKRLRNACNISEEFFKQVLDELRRLSREEVDFRDQTSLKGRVFKDVLGHLTKILAIVDKDSSNLPSIATKLREFYDKFRIASVSGDKKNQRLSYYSPWLENFSDIETNPDLEIPGQYRGDRKPLERYHVKIRGFSSEITKFKSLRSPLKLTIIGNDAKEHPFLVKFGEDLRQDQRIEQIFELMNNIFNKDSVCRERRLNLRTYQVIPLTGTLGLIECVPDTVTYREFLAATIPELPKAVGQAQSLYEKEFGGRDRRRTYLARHTSNSAVPAFGKIAKLIPSDVFRRAIWKLSVDSESFVALRNRFIKSHSVNAIANWILGIGDRHLSNSMISLTNCQTMDIDFGFVFGMSVQILPIPELVPFRLTPQLIQSMRPLNEHGLIEETMIHALRALRKNRDSLVSTMSVFIKEPSLEWMDFKRQEDTSVGYNWCPEKKLEHAKRKLEGASSVTIMAEELSDRTWDDQAFVEDCVKYVGEAVDGKRSGSSRELSVEDQVACLIEHATDLNLLIRMDSVFEGWI